MAFILADLSSWWILTKLNGIRTRVWHSFTWGPHVEMIVSKTKQRLAQLCHPSVYLDPTSLSIMYKSFVRSCLEYGHLLYFGAAKYHLDRLDALQHRAASIFHPCSYAAIGLTCWLLDGEGRGDLQSFLPTNDTRRSSGLIYLILPGHLDWTTL